ncbi:MAG: hypothetical protein AAF456_17820 [Planctomycetota bacterium]
MFRLVREATTLRIPVNLPETRFGNPKEDVSAAETSSELVGLFLRRRELMYQIAILIAFATTLLKLFSTKEVITHSGFDAELLVESLVFGGSTVFCLRMIQQYSGIIFHGDRFKVIEWWYFSDKEGKPPSQNEIREHAELLRLKSNSAEQFWPLAVNVFGVSFQIIFIFAIVSGVAGVALVNRFLTLLEIGPSLGRLLVIIPGGALTGVLIGWCFWSHNNANESACDFFCPEEEDEERDDINVKADEGVMRNHYLQSIVDAHSDMIAITAVVGSLTLSTITTTYNLIAGETVPFIEPSSGIYALLISFFTLCVSLSAVLVYIRLRTKGIAIFCYRLRIGDEDKLQTKVSDSGLGFFVLMAFVSINLALLCLIALGPWLRGTEYAMEILAGVAFVGPIWLGMNFYSEQLQMFEKSILDADLAASKPPEVVETADLEVGESNTLPSNESASEDGDMQS